MGDVPQDREDDDDRTADVPDAQRGGAGARRGGASLKAAPARAETHGLVFDPEGDETLATSVETSCGSVAVRYRFGRAVPDVARPVAPQYQVLNVSVPIEIDSVALDASAAPILLANAVGGYMPSEVSRAKGVDESGMAGPPPGTGLPGLAMPGGPPPADRR